MYPIKTLKKSFRLRSAVYGLSAAGLFFACFPQLTSAQRAGELDARPRMMEKIDVEEGARRLADFRGQRLSGDFCFRFELTHLPRRGKSVVYTGTMWGSWNAMGPVSRFELYPDAQGEASLRTDVIECIIQNGATPQAWIRSSRDAPFKLIEGAALFEPLLPGIAYSPFDLQMPFVYWEDFEYEGPGRVQSRIAQRFRMLPPEDSVSASRGVAAVRIALDDTYHALLRVEVLGAEDVMLSRFTMESFKKVQGQYIVKQVTIKDFETKDRTRFSVKAASVGLLFDSALFDADENAPLPDISEALFKRM